VAAGLLFVPAWREFLVVRGLGLVAVVTLTEDFLALLSFFVAAFFLVVVLFLAGEAEREREGLLDLVVLFFLGDAEGDREGDFEGARFFLEAVAEVVVFFFLGEGELDGERPRDGDLDWERPRAGERDLERLGVAFLPSSLSMVFLGSLYEFLDWVSFFFSTSRLRLSLSCALRRASGMSGYSLARNLEMATAGVAQASEVMENEGAVFEEAPLNDGAYVLSG